MNSVNVQHVVSVFGRVKGIPGNPGLARGLNGRAFNLALAASGTSGSTGFANNGFDGTVVVPATSTHVLDLRSFTNILNEPAQALSKLRLIYVGLADGSPGTAVAVGNSGANGLIVQGAFGTTPVQLAPGAFLSVAIPTAAGVTVNTTAKDIKLANTETTAATVVVGWWGE